MPKLFQVNCASAVTDPLEDNILMYMPSGVNQITPSLKGKAVDVCVDVTAEAADELQRQLAIFAEKGMKPYFSIGPDSHDSDIAAFWPDRFFWAKRPDATGKVAEGVWVEGQWSKSGRSGVEGKDVRGFSPTFFVDQLSNDERDPAKIIANEDANPNMGAFLNDPAFTKISPLWAKRARTDGYGDFVNDLKAANELSAGGPGSGPRKSGTSYEKAAKAAKDATDKAFSFQDKSEPTRSDYFKAADDNKAAASLHRRAATLAPKDMVGFHSDQEAMHENAAKSLINKGYEAKATNSLSGASASKTPGAPGVNSNQNNNSMENKETTQELQARKERLELTVNALHGKDDAVSKAELRACRSEIREIDALIEKAKTDTKNVQLEAQRVAQDEADADWAVQEMVEQGQIPIRGSDDLKDSWRAKFKADPGLIQMMCGRAPRTQVVTAPQGSQITPNANSLDASGAARRGRNIEMGFDLGDTFKHYAMLVCANARVNYIDAENKTESYRKKGAIALEAARFYKNVLAKTKDHWMTVPMGEIGKAIGLQAKAGKQPTAFQLQAADYTDNNDPTNVLGVLSGTLVLQQTLPFFAYKYPELLNFYTDFSDTPGLYKQTETTRIVTQPAVQKYSTTTDGTGRPQGWTTVSEAQTTDVSLTLTDYIAVPINMGQNLLAATTRRLFDEQSVLAVKAIAGYFVGMLTNIFTSATYNAYATIGTNGVNVQQPGAPFPTYVKAYQDFSMSDLDNLDSIFTSGKVPEEDRGLMLVPSYYAKLRGDPRLSFYYAASAASVAGASDFISEAKLPKLSGFAPYKSPYLAYTNTATPNSTPTANAPQANIVGFAFQKAGALIKSRLPQDFSQALGVMIPGSVTTITDPDTLISVMLVQYVNLTQNYAEWRPEVMLGVAAADTRAGLVLTSQ